MKTKLVLGLIAFVILAGILGPLLAHTVAFLVGSAVTILIAGGVGWGGYQLGRVAERRQLGR
jgi:hypothetical protein